VKGSKKKVAVEQKVKAKKIPSPTHNQKANREKAKKSAELTLT